ncbi:MAG: hypothetical protein IAE93_09095 [Ignavibacteria bacterium]|nr:hypothetical protein [Ignavibacteria bacterium]
MKCFFTDLDVNESYSDKLDVIEYRLEFENYFNYFVFSKRTENWVDDENREKLENFINVHGIDSALDGMKLIPKAISDCKHIFRSLILNKKLEVLNKTTLRNSNIRKILQVYNFPKTPKEKLDNLFVYLFQKQTYDGEKCKLDPLYKKEWEKLFFVNEREFRYYLDVLANYDVIDLFSKDESGRFSFFSVTFKGLEYFVEINEAGSLSKNCFVAMSFDQEDIDSIYVNGISPILNELGFTPILIKDEHYESDKTINDAMIASIKKSKFVISDFTKQKRNVYFEAGYAAGRGMPVIYMCKTDYFKDKEDMNKMSAFDTDHFPHIIWENIEDLKVKLKNKIEAFIL